MKINQETYDKIVKKLQRKLQPLDVEHIMVVDLDSNGEPEHFITLAKGKENSCELKMYKFDWHLLDYKPSGVIIVHNHPKNLGFPSENDNDLTMSASKICKRHKVKLMDHIIILKDYDFIFSYAQNEYYAKLGGLWQKKGK